MRTRAGTRSAGFSSTSLLRIALLVAMACAVFVTVASIVPTVVTVFRGDIVDQTGMLAASIAHGVDLLLDNATAALRLLEFAEQRTKVGLDRVVVAFPEFESVMVLDRSGKVILSAGSSIETGYDFSKRDFFVTPMANGERYVSPSFISGSTHNATASISLPFRDGVIVGTFDLRKLANHVYTLSPKRGERIVIVDSLGYFIAHTELERVFRRETMADFPDFARLKATKSGNRPVIGRDGARMMMSHAAVTGSGWIVLVGLPDDYFGRLFASVLNPVLASSALAMILSAFAVNLLLHRIKVDIDFLSERSNDVAAGDYGRPIAYRGFSDFGRLADSFSKMAEAVAERERELRRNELELKRLLDRTPVPMLVEDADGRILNLNAKFRDTFGWDADDVRTIDAWWTKAYPDPVYRDAMRELWTELVVKRSPSTGEIAPIEATVSRKDGSVRHVEIHTSVLGERNLAIFVDLTERKEIEQEIRSSEERYRTVFETSGDAMFMIDADGMRIVEANRNATRLFGYERPDFVGMDSGALMYGSELPTLGNGPGPATTCRRKDGSEFPAETQEARTVIGGREVVVRSVRDVTYKREAETRLLSNLAEKEVLLREIHHRVKNNLQLIISLLTLQSRSGENSGRDEAFDEAIDRIRVLSTIHEMLYESHNLSSIDFAEYVRTISESLTGSYAYVGPAPRLELELEPVQLGIDTAITCGLVVNETITNALKYAFAADRIGRSEDGPTLGIRLRRAEDAIEIEVSDNGPGIPDSVDPRNSETLGLQLVVLLVKQLAGSWELDRSAGTRWTFRFGASR